MEFQERSETPETDAVAFVEEMECEGDDDIQRCVSETRSLPRTAAEVSRLRALEVRVGEVLSTPVVGLMSQIALELEVLV